MIRPGRGVADRAREHIRPAELHGNGLAFAVLLSLLLWALLIVAALHLIARFLP